MIAEIEMGDVYKQISKGWENELPSFEIKRDLSNLEEVLAVDGLNAVIEETFHLVEWGIYVFHLRDSRGSKKIALDLIIENESGELSMRYFPEIWRGQRSESFYPSQMAEISLENNREIYDENRHRGIIIDSCSYRDGNIVFGYNSRQGRNEEAGKFLISVKNTSFEINTDNDISIEERGLEHQISF